MIQPLLFQSTTTDLTNKRQAIKLLDVPHPLRTKKNGVDVLYLPCDINTKMTMPDQKTLNASAVGPLHLDLVMSAKESALDKNHLVYQVGKIKPENHVLFYLKDENSLPHSKYYFLRCGKKYEFYSEEFYENHLEVNKALYTNFYMVLPLVLMSVNPTIPVKIYSMHVDDLGVKIKEYSITLRGYHLTINRSVIHDLKLRDVKKWSIENDLEDIVIRGFQKRAYAGRSIQRYYKTMLG